MSKRDLAMDLFKSFKTGYSKKFRTSAPVLQKERKNNGDPELLSDLVSSLIQERDWKSGIAEGTLYTAWPEIVGADVAAHTTPLSILDGVLTVQTSSTAWATQLTMVSNELLTTIQKSASGALVESLVVIGPHAPSWKKGIRTIRGARGPRDTYG
jgi:predicted nucleic acid-binding Zn ribbon protein